LDRSAGLSAINLILRYQRSVALMDLEEQFRDGRLDCLDGPDVNAGLQFLRHLTAA
jgi:hypothetical protein